MRPLIDKLVALKLQDQGISTDTRHLHLDRSPSPTASQRERPDITAHAAPDGTVTIMFSDIEDSTVLTERLGDQAWQDLLRKHNALIREQLQRARRLRSEDDGRRLHGRLPVGEEGSRLRHRHPAGVRRPQREHGEHVKVRIGLHAGEAIKDGDDFYGKNVILASRVAGKAVGGEILVSSLVRSLVESSIETRTLFGEQREVELKGLTGTHTVFPVRWSQ